MINKWKRAFFILLAVDVLFVIIVLLLLVTALPKAQPPVNTKWQTSAINTAPIFTVSGNKEQLASLMNAELQKEIKGNLEASILLNNQVEFTGSLKILGVKIPYSMLFDPKVENNGETVVLKETSATIGLFSLPVSQVMTFIQQGASLPKWVVVQPNKERLEVHLSGFVIRDQFTIRAEQIDLKHNKLIFNIYNSANKK
ncbi:YpmS family protein [Pullulanibacillus sp. KACC 23026]|uniref:YpmS family protein n=1 Tax=Pullulanibacillus sp. KACC 23026 TaxID=3028315 RepID=UPI0023B132C0|nr:YpmS family protein [Pullulanibacillus sp. KACC 23026]WEG12032.1 YpmS family protein [Pullulanibacillus sp. KACC 23026]